MTTRGCGLALGLAMMLAAVACTAGEQDGAERRADDVREQAAETAEKAAEGAQGALEATRDAIEDAKDSEAAKKAAEVGAAATEAAAGVTRAAATAAAGGALTATIKTALMADRTIDASTINVDTDETRRVVVLRGTVPTAAQRSAALAIARAKAPAYDVQDRLVVGAPTGQPDR